MHIQHRGNGRKADSMLTITEASRFLHVHTNTLRRWSDSGVIKAYRIGGRADRMFRQDDIERFLTEFGGNGGIPD